MYGISLYFFKKYLQIFSFSLFRVLLCLSQKILGALIRFGALIIKKLIGIQKYSRDFKIYRNPLFSISDY